MKIEQLDSREYELTIKCCRCGELKKFTVPVKGFDNYMFNRHINIQDAMPEVSPENREMIISQICPKCWEQLF